MCPESQDLLRGRLRRIRIAFSKGKHKKTLKLELCNKKLDEILGYSGQSVPSANMRNSSEPIRTLEKTRKQARVVYTALKHHWKCNGDCQPGSHEAYLNLGGAAISVGLDVMFPLSGGASAPCQILRQVRIVPAESKTAASVSDISHVRQSSLPAGVQQTFIQENTAARNQNLRTTLRLGPPSIRSSFKAKFGTKTQFPLGLEKSVKFGPLTVSVTPVASPDTTPSCTPDPTVQSASPQLIEDLCLFLANDQVKSGAFEVGMDSYFRRNKLDPGHHGVAADKLQLVTLPDLVEAHSYGLITISRQTQYEMAANITSALLQAYMSPWLSARWTKSDFLFLVDTDSQAIHSTHPLFSRGFYPPSSSTASSNQGRGNALDDAVESPTMAANIAFG